MLVGMFLLLSSFSMNAMANSSLRIIFPDVPPMAYIEKSEPKGYCVEVVQEIQKQLKAKSKLEMIPWVRALKEGQKDDLVLLICPKKIPERENLFKWVGPLITSSTSLFVRSESNIKVKTIEEAKDLGNIVMPRGFYSYEQLSSLGFKNLDTAEDPKAALKMLLAGRAAMLALDKSQVYALLAMQGKSTGEVREIIELSTANSYFAFSKSCPDKLVSQWQNELDKMKANGKLSKLQKKWFVTVP